MIYCNKKILAVDLDNDDEDNDDDDYNDKMDDYYQENDNIEETMKQALFHGHRLLLNDEDSRNESYYDMDYVKMIFLS